MNFFGIPSLDRLVSQLNRFPSIGPKSARRIAFHMLSDSREKVFELVDLIRDVKEGISFCKKCRHITEQEICHICRDNRRNTKRLCVVCGIQDLISIESAGSYDGLYFVLGGMISPVRGIGPEELGMDNIVKRVEQEGIEEVIIATSPNLEGETTLMCICELLKSFPVTITRLPYGLQMGTEIEFADPATLKRSFDNRIKI